MLNNNERPEYYDWVGNDSKSVAEVARKAKNAALMLASNEEFDKKKQEAISKLVVEEGYDILYKYYDFEFSFFVNYLYYQIYRREGNPSAIEVYLYLETTIEKEKYYIFKPRPDIYHALFDIRIKENLRKNLKQALIDSNDLLDSMDYMKAYKSYENKYDLENLRSDEEFFYIPVYPSLEDEKRGIKPCLISVREYLERLSKFYTIALENDTSPIKKSWWSAEKAAAFFKNCIDLLKRITKEDMAIPYDVLNMVFQDGLVGDEDILRVEELCKQDKFIRIRHYRCEEIYNYNTHCYSWLAGYYGELFYTWRSYLKNKEKYKCYEEYLRLWDDSYERQKYIVEEDMWDEDLMISLRKDEENFSDEIKKKIKYNLDLKNEEYEFMRAESAEIYSMLDND